MVTAMTRPTLLTAIMMVEIVVALVSLQMNALNVLVMEKKVVIDILIFLLVMVFAMMRLTMLAAILMVETVASLMPIQNIAQSAHAITLRLVQLDIIHC